jgi:hypothetical protein
MAQDWKLTALKKTRKGENKKFSSFPFFLECPLGSVCNTIAEKTSTKGVENFNGKTIGKL